jgi:hypothetical protein
MARTVDPDRRFTKNLSPSKQMIVSTDHDTYALLVRLSIGKYGSIKAAVKAGAKALARRHGIDMSGLKL